MHFVIHEAIKALGILFTPLRMAYLLAGVVIGLLVGLIPGLGGIVGLSLLLPFTFTMDPPSALSILMVIASAIAHRHVLP